MFGGGKKKEDPKVAAQMQKERDELQRMKATENIEAKMKNWEAKIDAKNAKINQMDQQIRQLIKAGKKDKAKQLLKRLKLERTSVVQLNKQINFMQRQVNGLDNADQERELFEMLKEANQVQEKNQKNVENLQEELEKAREMEEERKMNNDMLNDLLEDDEDEDELDDMLAEYEKDAALGLEDEFKNANLDTGINSNTNTNTNTNTAQKDEGFDALMANLMN